MHIPHSSSTMKYETLEVSVEKNIATILLNRPERLNSFDLKLGKELYEVLRNLADDANIRAIVIKGMGKGFCGGGDVKEMHAAENKPDFLRQLTKAIHRCVIEIRKMQKPVIAAVNGAAYGAGLSLVMACDLVIAIKDAKFNTAFINIGLAPGCGTYFVSRSLPYQKACELVLTARTFSAQEAFEMGLVNKVVDDLDEAVEEYTSKFRKLPPLAVGMAKMLLNEGMHNDLLTHLELESVTASSSASSEDFCEGVTAFVEKRKPLFKGS